MKSLEKLRGCTFIGAGKVNEYIDEIEREIAERYLPIPCDGDGVLIRFGDKVREVDDNVPMEVRSLTYYADCCVDVNSCGMNPNLLVHVKPRTLESVLQEYGSEIADSASKPWSEIVDKYAAEIRELLGVGE